MASLSGVKMGLQFLKAIREPNEFIMFTMKSDSEPSVWYILLHGFSGNNNEYEGGEYLVRQIAPENFPFSPPSFYFMTHNGVYDYEKTVCISIGEFHADEYRSVLGMGGFANQLISGMVGYKTMGTGISILDTTIEQKKNFAQSSYKYNRKQYPEIIKQIEDSFAEYSVKWTNVPEPMRLKLGLKENIVDPVVLNSSNQTTTPIRVITGKRGLSTSASIQPKI